MDCFASIRKARDIYGLIYCCQEKDQLTYFVFLEGLMLSQVVRLTVLRICFVSINFDGTMNMYVLGYSFQDTINFTIFQVP